MKMLIGIGIGLVVAWLFFGSNLRITNDAPNPPAEAQSEPQSVAQDPPPQAPAQAPAVQEAPDPTPTLQGRASLPEPPGAFTCPGSTVQNGGCLVTETTQLVSGLCVDYDPGSSSIAGPKDIVKEAPGWTRAKITGEAAWTPTGSGATATIYRDASCLPF